MLFGLNLPELRTLMVTHRTRTLCKPIWVIGGLFLAKTRALDTHKNDPRISSNLRHQPGVFIKALTMMRDPVSVCRLFESLSVSSEYAAYKRASVLHPIAFNPRGAESHDLTGGKWPWQPPRTDLV